MKPRLSNSRSVNSLLNGASGVLVQIFTILLNFGVRTVFIAYLDEVYLGVSGLFSNIFTMLSLAELGIGNAIIFRLYKPIAENDQEKIRTLVDFYKRCYTVIAIAVAVIGLALLPFLQYLVNTDTPVDGLYGYYLLYLLDTVATYAFTHKISLISANQRERVVTNNQLVINLFTAALQIAVLVFFKNFYLYLLVKIGVYFVFRFLLSRRASREYPYIKEKAVKKMDKAEKRSVFTDVAALFVYKVGAVLVNGTDNLIISAFISTNAVGTYSNYYMIINAIKTLMVKLLHGFTASIGNLNAIGEKKLKEAVFFQTNYLSFWLFSFGSACLLALTEPFIMIWIGEKFLFDFKILLALVIVFYVTGSHQIVMTYRDTTGLFRRGWYMQLITAGVNIGLSILGAIYWGVLGVFVATFVSELVTTSWFDPYLICKHALDIRVSKYYLRHLLYAAVTAADMFITYSLGNLIGLGGIFGFAVKCVVCIAAAAVTNTLLTCWMPEFRALLQRGKGLIQRKLK